MTVMGTNIPSAAFIRVTTTWSIPKRAITMFVSSRYLPLIGVHTLATIFDGLLDDRAIV